MQLTYDSPIGVSDRAANQENTAQALSLAGELQRVADGDRKAFEEVYRRTAGKLLAVCVQIIGRCIEADDVLQDVYCSIWYRADLFDEQRGSAMTWLITITRNRSVDHLRRASLRPTAPAELANQVRDPGPLPGDRIAADQEHRKMHRCLDAMNDQDASVLREAFFGSTTYATLALAAGIPLGTMKSRIRRALQQLRSEMA